jgi:hypothetical protein
MKKKVKKFGRGGDIITGIGAALVGKALYDKYMKGDDQGKDTNTGLKAGIDAGKKANEEREADAKKADAKKADAKKEESQREKYIAVGNEGKEGVFKNIPQYKKPEGPAAQDVSGAKPVSVIKNKDRRLNQNRRSNQNRSQNQNANTAKALQTYNSITAPNPVDKAPPPASSSSNTSKDQRKTSGFGPSNTFITKERSEAANASVGRARREQASRLFKGTDAEAKEFRERELAPLKKGGMVKKYASGGSVKASKMGSVKTAKPTMRSASARADGIAIRGKTRA